MVATYTIPMTAFPGGLVPVSWREFVERVDADVTVTQPIVEPGFKYSAYEIPLAIDLYFANALTGPEETIVTNLAGGTPGAEPASVARWLSRLVPLEYDDEFEDYGAATTTSGGPISRIDETPLLAGGKYLIVWSAGVVGTVGSTTFTARFVFARGEAEEVIIEGSGEGDIPQDFTGITTVVVPRGTYDIELEIEKTGGGGSASMLNSAVEYAWLAVS